MTLVINNVFRRLITSNLISGELKNRKEKHLHLIPMDEVRPQHLLRSGHQLDKLYSGQQKLTIMAAVYNQSTACFKQTSIAHSCIPLNIICMIYFATSPP